MKIQQTEEDPTYFDHYDPQELHEIRDTRHKITEYAKKNNLKIISDMDDS